MKYLAKYMPFLKVLALFASLLAVDVSYAAKSGFEVGPKPDYISDVSREDAEEGFGEILYWAGVFFLISVGGSILYVAWLVKDGQNEEAMKRGRALFFSIVIFFGGPGIIYVVASAIGG